MSTGGEDGSGADLLDDGTPLIIVCYCNLSFWVLLGKEVNAAVKVEMKESTNTNDIEKVVIYVLGRMIRLRTKMSAS
jgi:hypothetical protein